MKKYAVIVAGGSGTRMGTSTPKQFLELLGKPVLYYSVNAFINAFPDVEVIVVVPGMYLSQAKELLDGLYPLASIQVVGGGETRFDSVKNGLATVLEPSIIFVHDAVRCLVSEKLLHRCFEQAVQKGSAIPVVTATDSIRMQKNDRHWVEDRDHVKIVQTPQTFRSEILLPCFRQSYQPEFTDEATVVEACGQQVFLVEGEYQNLKITRPIDLLIAERLLTKEA